jgi:uncharacterized protein YaaQ
MTRIFDAECENNIVKLGEHVINPTPTIPSQGKRASTGAFLLYGNKSFYLTSNAADIVDLITQLKSAIDSVASALPTIASATGDLGAIAAASSCVATLNSVSATINTLKGNLK